MTTERNEVLDLLAELSNNHPEMRLGQWLLMFAYSARGTSSESIYDVEDEELIPVMRRFLENRNNANQEVALAGR